MNFEFLYQNYFATTTAASVTAGTASISYLIDRDRAKLWTPGTQQAQITITFSPTVTVDRIIIENHNIKDMTIYANGVTATTLALATGSDTTASDWTGMSETESYLVIASATALVQLDIQVSATSDGENISIGQVWVAEKLYELPENPSYRDYKPTLEAKQYEHEMSDGGVQLYSIADSFQADVGIKYATAAVISNLRTIYDLKTPIVFVPFPTVTGWTGDDIREVNWIGGFELKQPAGNNYNELGYEGRIRFRETAK